jgi:hypothetical protein
LLQAIEKIIMEQILPSHFSSPHIMPKANAGYVPNLEGDKVGEKPSAISNIPPKTPHKALELPLNMNPLSGPHTSQQSLVSIKISPLARISIAIYQEDLY